MQQKCLLKLLAPTLAGLLLALLPITLAGAASSTILINAIYYDTYLSGEPDEVFHLILVQGGGPSHTCR